MKRMGLFAVLPVAGFFLLLGAEPMQALTRTYVATNGSDSNTCDQTAPCATFNGAIANTSAGGEVNVQNTGNYTSFTILTSLTVKAVGAVGSITPLNIGITINAGASDVVILSGLEINGAANNSTIGIRIVSAKEVHIIDCHIFGVSQSAIRDERTAAGSILVVRHTNINDSAGLGILLAGSNVRATVDNVHANANNYGIAIASGNSMNVDRSTFTGNKTAGVESDSGARLFIDNSAINNNVGAGVLSNSSVVLNNTSVLYNGGAGIGGPTYSYGNNRIIANGGTDSTLLALSLK